MNAQQGGIHFTNAAAGRGTFTLQVGTAALMPGAVTVLLGANASGKTTVLRAAAGLDKLVSGSVSVAGHEIRALSQRQLAARIAFVPQRPSVGAPFTVAQVVALGRYALTPDPARVLRALDLVRLRALAELPYHSLSTGQQQRVTLARALAQHETGGALLLDEALAAVDPPETHQLVHLLRQLAAGGSAVVMATHDLALAAALADHVWFLANGKIAAMGSAAEVLRAETLSKLTGVPVVAAIGARGTLPVPDLTAILQRDA